MLLCEWIQHQGQRQSQRGKNDEWLQWAIQPYATLPQPVTTEATAPTQHWQHIPDKNWHIVWTKVNSAISSISCGKEWALLHLWRLGAFKVDLLSLIHIQSTQLNEMSFSRTKVLKHCKIIYNIKKNQNRVTKLGVYVACLWMCM